MNFEKLIAPLKRRVLLMVGRAVLTAVKDSTKTQGLQIKLFDGEVRDDVERFQNYGLTSVPEEGAEALVLFLGGNRDHGVVVAVEDRRYRPKGLKPGEVCVYHKNGDKILLKDGNEIEATTQKFTIISEKLQIKNNAGQEIVDIVSDLINAISSATTATMMGTQPLISTPETWAQIKARIDQFKVGA